jgi:hypothetical protein
MVVMASGLPPPSSPMELKKKIRQKGTCGESGVSIPAARERRPHLMMGSSYVELTMGASTNKNFNVYINIFIYNFTYH